MQITFSRPRVLEVRLAIILWCAQKIPWQIKQCIAYRSRFRLIIEANVACTVMAAFFISHVSGMFFSAWHDNLVHHKGKNQY